MELPVWQSLYAELKDTNLQVITVALDSGGTETARRWIEAAKPGHPSLIDRHHTVADLYGFVNVPAAVWIDEDGTLVRPAHAPASNEHMAAMIGLQGSAYLDALRDWVEHGDASAFAPSRDMRRSWLRAPEAEAGLAAANFRLGEYLLEIGDLQAARPYLDEAHRLQPHNWAYRRQAWVVYDPANNFGRGWYDAAMATGDVPYYAPVQLGDTPAPTPAETAQKQRDAYRKLFGKAFGEE